MSAATVSPANNSAPRMATALVPREHGATAMLLTPFFAAAILLRDVHWLEVMALVAIACAFAIKDPLVVIARQCFVWKQEHAETSVAKRSAVIQSLVLAGCGITLMMTRDWRQLLPLFAGAAAFTALAVTVTVRNQQRSEWFQVASAVALTATCLAACLAAIGTIPEWCWLLWMLCATQAAAGIFVVHARLDARIAARRGQPAENQNRRAAIVCEAVLVACAVFFTFVARVWLAVALIVAATGYLAELTRQKNQESLQMPLKRVGLEALCLSIAYALLVVVGLWNG